MEQCGKCTCECHGNLAAALVKQAGPSVTSADSDANTASISATNPADRGGKDSGS